MIETPELNRLVERFSEGFDLTNENFDSILFDIAQDFLEKSPSLADLQKWEEAWICQKRQIPLPLHLAIKLARSKRFLIEKENQSHVSIVFAVYKEHYRILPKSKHLHGENFLIRKIKQLEWLARDAKNFSWDLTLVDDGCPERTGDIAIRILDNHPLADQVNVLFLADAIERNLPIVSTLKNTNDSQKGGSILYGMWSALQTERKNHIVLYTDADLSTHLGQIGLLLETFQDQSILAAIGSRREKNSIVRKTGHRNARGKLFIFLWKGLLNNLDYIIDTQCAFKAFRAQTAKEIISNPIETKFAFDIELLLKTEIIRHNSIAKIPIAWIDSVEASTVAELEPYSDMLKSTVAMYRKYLKPTSKADDFATFIDRLNNKAWEKLQENMPKQLLELEPSEIGKGLSVSLNQLKNLIE